MNKASEVSSGQISEVSLFASMTQWLLSAHDNEKAEGLRFSAHVFGLCVTAFDGVIIIIF